MDWPAEIGIVGGGIVGLTSAFVIDELAQADGATPRIVLYEQNTFGSGSTASAGCGLRTFYACHTNIQLAQAGLRFWRNAESLLNQTISFRENGYLFLAADAARADDLDARTHRQHAVGERAVTVTDVQQTAAFVDGSYERGVYTPEAALADPELMAHALVDTLEDRANCSLYFGTPVSTLHRDGRVETASGTQTHDVLVNAAGGWGPSLAEDINESFPIWPQARRLARLDTTISTASPLTVDLDTGVYVLPNADGDALIGGYFGDERRTTHPDSPAAFSRERDPSWEDAITDAAQNMSTTIADASVVGSWTGLYSMTDSRRPFIERTGNVIHALGFSGHGIMQAPGAAQIVASLVRGDRPSLVPHERLVRGRNPVRADIQF